MVNTREYEWADVSVVMAGRMITGLRGIKYTSKQDKDLLYAKGNKPHSVQRGNKSYNGEITLVQSEYEALKKAGGGDILDVTMNVVVAYGNPSAGDAVTIDTLIGVEFTEDNTDWTQGDKYQEKRLPFLYLDQKSA